MKKASIIYFALCLTMSCSAALASETSPPVSPCKSIQKACESAGYTKGGHKGGKGLLFDCYRPLLKGQTVAGIDLKPAEIQSCRGKRSPGNDDSHRKAAK